MDWHECEKRYWPGSISRLKMNFRSVVAGNLDQLFGFIYQLIRLGQRIFQINPALPGSTHLCVSGISGGPNPSWSYLITCTGSVRDWIKHFNEWLCGPTRGLSEWDRLIRVSWFDRIERRVKTSIGNTISQVFRCLPKFRYVYSICNFESPDFLQILCGYR
jgi:hypothetical protein